MTFETKEQVLEQIMTQDKPKCPHCGVEMNLWEVPPINFSDGLGWGTPYLYLCFNDECPLYIEGWQNLEENYSHKASYRCLCYPGTEQYECMPVFSPVGGTGQIIDEQVVAQQEMLKENTKKGFNILATCITEQDWVCVVRMLLDPTEPPRVRVKAAEIVGDYGNLDAVEAIRNYKFGNDILQEKTQLAVKKIHERSFTRECPFCAEIIKSRANICKHCGREVAGE
jgi:RNA polymerase subunit RPABC4/transcription elongation factor Spt4